MSRFRFPIALEAASALATRLLNIEQAEARPTRGRFPWRSAHAQSRITTRNGFTRTTINPYLVARGKAERPGPSVGRPHVTGSLMAHWAHYWCRPPSLGYASARASKYTQAQTGAAPPPPSPSLPSLPIHGFGHGLTALRNLWIAARAAQPSTRAMRGIPRSARRTFSSYYC